MYDTKSPLKDALAQIMGIEPPFPDIEGAYTEKDMGDYPLALVDGFEVDLAEWCGWMLSSRSHQPGAFTTGTGIVEAAELMVKRAVENANIPPKANQ